MYNCIGIHAQTEGEIRMDWKEPFEIAGQLALAIVGWSLVLIVGMFGILLALAFAKTLVSLFTKKNGKKKKNVI